MSLAALREAGAGSRKLGRPKLFGLASARLAVRQFRPQPHQFMAIEIGDRVVAHPTVGEIAFIEGLKVVVLFDSNAKLAAAAS